MNETLSINQANQLINAVDDELQALANDINAYSDEFMMELSRVWEDKNAVDFASKYNETMTEVISVLGKNNNTLIETIGDIATYYAKTGNMSERPKVLIKIMKANINYQVIKEIFADSENGDDFGFKNVKEGAQQVMDTYDQYKTKVEHRASQLASRMNGINAFGNNVISMELTKSAGKIVEAVNRALATIGRNIEEGIAETANAYIAAGVAASDIIKDISPEGEIINKIDRNIIHQKMYGISPTPEIGTRPGEASIGRGLTPPTQKLYASGPIVGEGIGAGIGSGIIGDGEGPGISIAPPQKLYASGPAGNIGGEVKGK